VIDRAKHQTCRSDERALRWRQRGATGLAGPSGPAGPAGPAGQLALTYVQTEVLMAGGGALQPAQVECPDGLSVTGGSVEVIPFSHAGSPVEVQSQYPIDSGADADSVPDDGWATLVIAQAPDGYPFRVHAVCARAASVT
jgi:hypothetical protein